MTKCAGAGGIGAHLTRGQDDGILPPMTQNRTPRRRTPIGAEPGTLQYWLVRTQLTIDAMERGLITSAECSRRCAAYKEALAMMLQLRTLKLNGIPDEVDPVAAELAGMIENPKVAGEKVVTVKRGISATGAPIDETTVVVHTTAASPGEAE